MFYILFFLIMFNNSFFISNIFKKKIEETLAINVVFSIIIIFIFGMFNRLDLGYYFYLILTAGSLVGNVIFLIKEKTKNIKYLLTPGLIISILLYAFFIVLNQGRMLSVWDEFSHWGLVVKNMFMLNNFGLGSDSTLLARGYLSGTSLFQYLALKIGGNFNETYMFTAMNFIYLSFVIPITQKIKIKNLLTQILLFLSLIFLPLTLFGQFFSSLYVDGILGIAFAYGIFNYFINRKEKFSLFNIINTIISFSALILIKDFGILLAFFLGLIILIDQLFVLNKFKFNFKFIFVTILKVFSLASPSLIIKGLWILKSSGSVSSSGSLSVLNGLKTIFSFGYEGYQETIVKNYIEAVSNRSLMLISPIRISFLFLILLMAFMTFYWIYKSKTKEEKNKYKLLGWSVVSSGVLYAIFLLASYLSIFGEYEGVKLASYERYIGSFGIAIIFIVFMFTLFRAKKNSIQNIVAISTIIIIFTCIEYAVLANNSIYSRTLVSQTIEMRANYSSVGETITNNLNKDDKVYFISEGSDGFDFYVFRYEITPIKSSDSHRWSIGEPRYEKDIWTWYVSATDWKNILINNYEYVYLYNIDEDFIKDYGMLFKDKLEIKARALFKVDKNSENNKILELVVE